MKKLFVVLAIVAITLMAGAAMAASTLVGTAHDLRSGGVTEICVYCHTPHYGNVALPNIPLWNRNADGSAYATSTYNTWNTTTDPRGTRICLSCHDGSVTTTTLLNEPGPGTTGLLPGGNVDPSEAALTMIVGEVAEGGNDLSNDHPVGVAFATWGNMTATNPGTLPLFGAGSTVECATCHMVHDDTNTMFLRASNTDSALCVACHADK